MESGQAFSLKVVAYDRKRKSGGQIKDYPEAVLLQVEEDEIVSEDIFRGNRPNTQKEAQQIRMVKEAHHRKWYTRNIRILQNGHPTSIIKKIHPPLIIEFNGQKVTP